MNTRSLKPSFKVQECEPPHQRLRVRGMDPLPVWEVARSQGWTSRRWTIAALNLCGTLFRRHWHWDCYETLYLTLALRRNRKTGEILIHELIWGVDRSFVAGLQEETHRIYSTVTKKEIRPAFSVMSKNLRMQIDAMWP